MSVLTLKEQIISELEELSPAQQRQVLKFTRQLKEAPPKLEGIPGEVLWERAREINFDPEDLKEIMQAIEEDCERIDLDGW